MKTLRSYSSAETQKFAEALACLLMGRKPPPLIVAFLATIPNWPFLKKAFLNLFLRRTIRKSALVFALSGELGSGKTTFIQGFLRGLGIRKHVTSPTFILFRRFAIRPLRLG